MSEGNKSRSFLIGLLVGGLIAAVLTFWLKRKVRPGLRERGVDVSGWMAEIGSMVRENTVKLIVTANEIEARGIASFLAEEGLDCVVVPYRDTAYPGVSDRERPWGTVRVAASDLAQAEVLLKAWQAAVPENLEDAWRRSLATNIHEEAKKTGWPGTPAVLAGCLIALVVIYLIMKFV